MPAPILVLLSVGTLLAGGIVAVADRADGRGAGANARGATHHQVGGTPNAIRVTGRRRQVFEGWGGTVVTSTFRDPQAAPVGLNRRQLRRLESAVYGEAGINVLRIYGPGFRRPVVDGDGRLRRSDGRWALMRRARRRGVRLLFTASNAPVKMKDGRNLADGREADFARYIADNLSFAKRLGAPFDLAAIGNEVDNPSSFIPLLISAEQAALVYDALAREIARRDLPTRLAIGDTQDWSDGLRYATAALESARVRRLARVLAVHSYGGDQSRTAVKALAARHGLSLWMTEWTGAGCLEGNCPDTRAIDFALRWAEQINRDLTDPGVRAWFVLRPVDDSTHGADSGILVRTRDNRRRPFYRTKRFFILRQFSSAARPGARRLVVEGELPALAFRQGRRLRVVVSNFEASAKRVTLRLGSRPGRLGIRRTSQRENFERLKGRAYRRGRTTARLPAKSVTTFTLVYRR